VFSAQTGWSSLFIDERERVSGPPPPPCTHNPPKREMVGGGFSKLFILLLLLPLFSVCVVNCEGRLRAELGPPAAEQYTGRAI
jgi:hypothetical protein